MLNRKALLAQDRRDNERAVRPWAALPHRGKSTKRGQGEPRELTRLICASLLERAQKKPRWTLLPVPQGSLRSLGDPGRDCVSAEEKRLWRLGKGSQDSLWKRNENLTSAQTGDQKKVQGPQCAVLRVNPNQRRAPWCTHSRWNWEPCGVAALRKEGCGAEEKTWSRCCCLQS